MKPILASLLALSLCLFAACAPKDAADEEKTYTIAESGSWTDGTYSTEAEGYIAPFTVQVTIENGRLAAIDASDNSETADIGASAIQSMIPDMIAAQTYDVDAASGATASVEALRDAVARCLEEASGGK